MRRLPLLALTLTTLMLVPATAHAFMTWNSPGNAEHERITRLGIACNSALDRRPAPAGVDWKRDLCLPSSADSNKQPGWFSFERSMRMLAGTDGYFGGVGAPDRFAEAVLSSSDRAHCDNADAWFPTTQGPFGSYPRTFGQRAAGLSDCLHLLQRYVGVAVEQAGLLVNSNGQLDAPQSDLSEDCNVDYDPDLNPGKTHDRGWAKCNALIAFGRALHITEDFYSHSNWIDLNPSSVDIKNPPGLHNDLRNVPSALGYPRSDAEIAAFIDQTQVITGAFPKGANRVNHDDYLNKDEGTGTINWTTGQIPLGDKGHSVRSAAGSDGAGDNFQRAAKGAAYAAASLWVDYRAGIFDRYGADRGAKIWEALRDNTPWTQCGPYGPARRAQSPPNGEQSAARTIRVHVINQSSSPLPCNDARLASGEWSSLPADSVAPGGTNEFLVLSNGGGIDGMVQIGWAVFSFSNPLVGSNSYSCVPYRGLSCTTSGGKGNDATITLTITDKSARSSQTPRRVNFAVPGRAARAGGSAAVAARSPDYRAPPLTTAMLNPKISAKNRRELRSEVKGIRACGGAGAVIKLRVDDISCTEALRVMLKTSRDGLERHCPAGWRVLYYPQGIGAPKDATLCHHDSDVNNPSPDLRARAFFYVLPH